MHSEEAKIYITLLIAATILGLILIFFIITILRQQKKTRQLYKEKINAEITTLENERKRIAADLHDEVAVFLSVAKLELSGIRPISAEDQILLAKASAHIDDGVLKIREITKALMPVTLTRKGLFQALEELFDSINYTSSLKVQYSFPETSINISANIQVHLYRILQEILHNTIKHAEASEIVFDFQAENNCLKINVTDNGQGFNHEYTLRNYESRGLHNLMTRIEILDGDLYLETAEGKGVNFTIEIPIIPAS